MNFHFSGEVLNGASPTRLPHNSLVIRIPKLFSQSECEQLTAAKDGFAKGKVRNTSKERQAIHEVRSFEYDQLRSNCLRELLQSEQFAKIRIDEAIASINQKYFQYDILPEVPEIYVNRYLSGQHFSWHLDYGSHSVAHRKLTLVAQLTPESAYEGGELEFMPQGKKAGFTAPKEQGDAFIFNSLLFHRANAIIRGTRYSLSGWAWGPC